MIAKTELSLTFFKVDCFYARRLFCEDNIKKEWLILRHFNQESKDPPCLDSSKKMMFFWPKKNCSLDVILKISESDMSQILDLNTTQEVTQGHSLECHFGWWHHILFKIYSFQAEVHGTGRPGRTFMTLSKIKPKKVAYETKSKIFIEWINFWSTCNRKIKSIRKWLKRRLDPACF